MKASTALLALALGLCLASESRAQLNLFRRNPPKPPAAPPAQADDPARLGKLNLDGTRTPAPADPNVQGANLTIPPATNPNDLPPPKIPLPPEPIEPYLLTRQAGPFMVLAHTFKGPYAEKSAQLLVMELKNHYHIPAYVFRPKDFPMNTNMRGVPPQVPFGQARPMLAFPERERVKDEAAVLVGDEKSIDDAQALMHKVKKLRPDCLAGLPDWHGTLDRNGLRRAIQTTNPYAPAETLFPQKPDVLVQQMNKGPHSITNCPGRFSLQVAEFTGRSTLQVSDGVGASARGAKSNVGLLGSLKASPLATAHEEAEKLANNLARDKDVRQTGYVPYVYHDRNASYVFMGAFNAPTDPEARKLRDRLIRMASDLNNRFVSDVILSPATELTDVKGDLGKPKITVTGGTVDPGVTQAQGFRPGVNR